MSYVDLSEQVKSVRKAAGLTQTDFADKLGVHPQTVSKWERGKTAPDVSQLGDIADVCGVTLEKLLDMPADGQVFGGRFDMQSMCAKIAELRRSASESQNEIADVCNSSPDAVSRWERGLSCPDVSELCAIARHYGKTCRKCTTECAKSAKTLSRFASVRAVVSGVGCGHLLRCALCAW